MYSWAYTAYSIMRTARRMQYRAILRVFVGLVKINDILIAATNNKMLLNIDSFIVIHGVLIIMGNGPEIDVELNYIEEEYIAEMVSYTLD